MDITNLVPILTALIGAGSAAAVLKQKTATEKSKLAGDEYASASAMVRQYVSDLHDLGEKVEQLQTGLINANNELAALRLENSQFRQQIAELQRENHHLQGQVTELLAENERLRQ
jgi:predicted RNase H-like nuclease (RuvC/YqgF family)